MIRLSDALNSVHLAGYHHYYHFKSISILTGNHEKGGCYAAGPLTSQALLHTMSCLGLIPIELAECGELVKDHDFLSLNDITIENGLSHKFLRCLSLELCIIMSEAEHVTCKYHRALKNTDCQYNDAIFSGQKVYSILNGSQLVSFNGDSTQRLTPTGLNWPDKQTISQQSLEIWRTSTAKKPIGKRGPKKRKRIMWYDDRMSQKKISILLPPILSIIMTINKPPLFLVLGSPWNAG